MGYSAITDYLEIVGEHYFYSTKATIRSHHVLGYLVECGKTEELWKGNYELDLDITPRKLQLFPFLEDEHASLVVVDF